MHAPLTERNPVTGQFRKVTPLTVKRLVTNANQVTVAPSVTVVRGRSRATATRAEVNALVARCYR